MAVSLPEFIYNANEDFAEKAYNLIKCWRIGVKSCANETDLIVLSMYLKFLNTDLSDYNITVAEVMTVIEGIGELVDTTDIPIGDSDVLIYNNPITNNIVYNTTIVNEIQRYTTTYSGVDVFTVAVNHGLNKFNPTVIVTDTSTGSRIRIEVGITEIDRNNIVLSFASSSSGDITVM